MALISMWGSAFGFFMRRGVSMGVLAFVARDFCKEAFEI
jgi:hypothetical protein